MSRNANGAFAKGNRYGKGRLKGSRNWNTILKQHLRSDWNQIATMFANEKFEHGRRWAARTLRDHLPGSFGEPLAVDLGGLDTLADILGAEHAVMMAIAERQIGLFQGQKLVECLKAHRQTLKDRSSTEGGDSRH